MITRLQHPPFTERREQLKALQLELRELGRARNLMQVANALVSLQNGVFNTAQLHGIDMSQLGRTSREVKKALRTQAGKDKTIIVRYMPGGRMPHKSIKSAIVAYAQTHGDFTVDQLQQEVPLLRNCRRRCIAANLVSLTVRRERPLIRKAPGLMGRNGQPAVYALRPDNKGV